MDYQFSLTEEQLRRTGAARGLMTQISRKELAYYTRLLSSCARPIRCGGGSAVNSLVAYVHFGGTGSFYGIIGDDESGRFFVKELRQLGADVHCESSSDQATGHCLVMITPDGERTLLTHLGINIHMTPVSSPSFAAARLLYAESYLFSEEAPRRTLMHYLKAARKQSKDIALSLSDVFITRNFSAQIHTAISDGISLLFGNRDEFHDYTGKREPKEIFSCLKDYVETVVMTDGKSGSWICTQDGIIRVSTLQVRVRDTAGAGDAYAGAFLYALLNHKISFERIGSFASAAAAQVVSRFGPRLSAAECHSLRRDFFPDS